MDNATKKKHLKRLEEQESFKNILSLAENDDQRKKIKAFAEDIYVSLIEGFTLAQKIVAENPEKVAEVMQKRIPKE